MPSSSSSRRWFRANSDGVLFPDFPHFPGQVALGEEESSHPPMPVLRCRQFPVYVAQREFRLRGGKQFDLRVFRMILLRREQPAVANAQREYLSAQFIVASIALQGLRRQFRRVTIKAWNKVFPERQGGQ